MSNTLAAGSLLIATGFFPGTGNGLLAYVGPAGIGALGVLFVVVAVVLIGAVGLVLHPVRLILRRRRRLREEQQGAKTEAVSPQSLEEIR